MTPSIVCFGDNCVDLYEFPRKRRFVGGNALNAAVHAKAAGCAVSYVGSVGRDGNGRAVLQKLAEKGIDARHVQVFDTETAWTKVSFNGTERVFAEEFLGPVAQFELTRDVLDYLFTHSLIHNTWQGGTERKLPLFKQEGKSLISMDFGERYSREFLELCIPFTDVAFFSTDTDSVPEAETFAHTMHLLGPDYVVVTMGKHGSVVSQKDGETWFAPIAPAKVVDTLGAGDTYIGTFLAAFVRKEPIPACMRLATEAAARTCTLFSGFPGSEILDGE
ncbi:MAG TPA: PfkB family carbohydrate kinase [Candidatus Cryosericum sp.]|nr:PfkB family carbohydrate kinase [Candidatus Cryosericum sp.]